MNIYFTPTERNELNFPTDNLSVNVIETMNEEVKIDNNSDNALDKEETEINEFYKKYSANVKLFEKTKSKKKLNKVKVYLIVKSKIMEGKEVKYAIPIRSFDDLGNSIVEKSNAFIASLFYVKVDDEFNELESSEGSPGSRPFRLEQLMHPEPPYNANEEFPLERLMLPKKYGVDGRTILDRSEDDPEVNDPEKLVIESIENALGEVISYFYYLSEYEYNESMIDNTFLVNSSRYGTDIRAKKSFKGEREETGFLSRLKELNSKEGPFKLFTVSNIVSLIFGNASSLIDKNIIPVFSNLEDAQDLLITILEEIHQPFQVRRKVENPSTFQYSKSLSYLDDSFSFQNSDFVSDSVPDTNKIKDLIKEYIKIDFLKTHILTDSIRGLLKINKSTKSDNFPTASNNEFYNENKYQTKGPFFIEDADSLIDVPMSQQVKSAPKFIWRETDYWSFLNHHFPNQPENYSWWESRDMSNVDKGLLKKSQDVKIISMGLDDFLEFWNNPMKKNAKILFIPSTKNYNKKPFSLSRKKSRDKFYEYQQKFRSTKKQDSDNYVYEMKVSSK